MRISNQRKRRRPIEVGYPGLPGKTMDPVRIYLKEMGSFPLLTREGEVEVAKRIESGQQEILCVLLNCHIAIREIIHLGKALRAGKTKIYEVTNEIDDEETNSHVERLQKKGFSTSSIKFRKWNINFSFFKRNRRP